MLDIARLTIIPRGTLVKRMNVLVGAKIAATELRCPLSVVWDHAIAYSDLFMDDIQLVSMDDVSKGEYIYNPHMDPNYMVNHARFHESGPTLVIETSEAIRLFSSSYMRYALKKKAVYHELLKEHVNGWFLGQINLIDVPPRPVVCVLGNRLDRRCSPSLNMLSLDCDDLEDAHPELLEYIRAIAASKSDLIICTEASKVDVALEASAISMCPLVLEDSANHSECATFYESALMRKPYGIGECSLIHPDVVRFSLYVMISA